MSDIFFAEYMNKCIDEGKRAPHEICASAEDEIKQIDKRISEIENLRSRQLKLHSIVRTLSGKTREVRCKQDPVMDFNLTEGKLDKYMKNLCVKICSFIDDRHPNHVTPRDIMDEVTSIRENKASYTAIKWLWKHGIITRVESNISRPIIKGENWDKRPIL